jgi:hypothetical protein
MKTICRFIAVTVFCLASLGIKSEQTFSKTKCSKLSISRIMVETNFNFASYENDTLPYEYGFFIKI